MEGLNHNNRMRDKDKLEKEGIVEAYQNEAEWALRNQASVQPDVVIQKGSSQHERQSGQTQ